MNAKRKEVEAYILKYMAKLDKSGTNVEKYQKMFADMDDKAFNAWMENLKNHKDVLVFWIPAMKVNPRVKDLLSICKELSFLLKSSSPFSSIKFIILSCKRGILGVKPKFFIVLYKKFLLCFLLSFSWSFKALTSPFVKKLFLSFS